MNILIITEPFDMHAIAVELALNYQGHQCTRLIASDYPQLQTHSCFISKDWFHWHCVGAQFDSQTDAEQCDVVWLRRLRKPIISSNIHPDDLGLSYKENMAFYLSIWQIILRNSVWVNSFENMRRSESKVIQLRLAQQLGLRIPDTLISNDPQQIQRFIEEDSSQTIYKSFLPLSWCDQDHLRLAYTQIINLDNLPRASTLQSTPGIYQKYVNKQAELRVTFFGLKAIAVKIHSRHQYLGNLDWRKIPYEQLELSHFDLDNDVYQQCLYLMNALGITFGCFDFILDEQGHYIFLEVNQQGQFLWIERLLPELPMLDFFCKFLLAEAGMSHRQLTRQKKVALHDFFDDIDTLSENDGHMHLDPGRL